jgi:hypothetical protein
MSSSIKIKRSEVAGNPSTLGAGELAYSALTDNGSNGGDRLYIGTGIETSGNAVNHVVIGGKYFTDMVSAATASNTALTIVKRDASGNFTAGTVTATSFVGPLTGNALTATAWATARNLSLTGDATATLTAVDGSAAVSAALTLATVNTNVGSFGSTTEIPVITVNGKGLVTSITTASISSSLSIVGGTGTDTVSLLTDTLTFAGGTGVATTVTNNQVSFAIGQDVATTANVAFNNVTVNGTLSSDDITSTNINVSGNATITGNLTVQGTTTTVNSTAVAISDVNLTLAKDAANAAQANGAGLTVNGSAATLTYTNADDRWNLNKDLNVANVYGALKGNADTATSSAKWTTARNLSLTGDATATLSSVDGSAAVSAALTLATVNANVGSFGDGTSIPTFTVNAKGLITAAGSVILAAATNSALGLASFTTSDFTVTAGVVSIKAVDGGTY